MNALYLSYRQAEAKDLDRIMEIEQTGFSAAEAASRPAMQERIQKIPDSFIVAENAQEIVGYVVGPVVAVRYLYDELFEKTTANPETGGYQTILSLVVAPEYQRSGVASALLDQLKQICQHKQRAGITLTCLEELIPFYQRNGYQLEGVSASEHAGETWYNLVSEL